MTRNIGTIDRALRTGLGLLLISLTLSGVIGPWGWLGIVPLATAAVGWCPAYLPLGLNTCGQGPGNDTIKGKS